MYLLAAPHFSHDVLGILSFSAQHLALTLLYAAARAAVTACALSKLCLFTPVANEAKKCQNIELAGNATNMTNVDLKCGKTIKREREKK